MNITFERRFSDIYIYILILISTELTMCIIRTNVITITITNVTRTINNLDNHIERPILAWLIINKYSL